MEILNISSKREELLIPLLKWRYLGLNDLAELSNYQCSKCGLQYFVLRLENEGILNSFIHKFSNCKYVYLSRKAYIELTEEPWNLNEEIKMHDAIVSSVLYQFSKLENTELVKINYPNISYNESIFSSGIDPDGMVRMNRKGQGLNIAFELELTRKNSGEIFRKFKLYYENTSFDWTIYFFSRRKTLKSYFKYYNQFRDEKNIKVEHSQIMFCYSDAMATSSFDLLNCYWIRPDGISSKLKELFL